MDDLTRHADRLPDCDCHECAIYERNRLRAELAACREDADRWRGVRYCVAHEVNPKYTGTEHDPNTTIAELEADYDRVGDSAAELMKARKGEGE